MYIDSIIYIMHAHVCIYWGDGYAGVGGQRERETLRQEKLGFYIKRSQPAQCKHISPMTEGTLFFYCQALMPQYTVAAQ